MSKESRFQEALHAVWERSHDEYLGWPEAKRTAAEPAIDALMSALRHWTKEPALELFYWQPGDPAGAVLRRHLPEACGPEELLTVEDACFWRRLIEIRGDA